MGRNGVFLVTVALALGLAACAPEDDTIGSRLAQPAPNAPERQPVDAGDIAIVGQDVAHSIMDLPAISSAAVPPMVKFDGVTSIITPPIETAPYTELFRDRLLLLTREKLRFQEHTLPPLFGNKKSGDFKSDTGEAPDYEVLAEMRGHADSDTYKIQVQFIDIHSNGILFDGLYRIHKEEDTVILPQNNVPSSQPQQSAPAQPGMSGPGSPDYYKPPPPQPSM